MKQEDKELLLKDLSARLPYGVKCIVTKSRTEEGQKGDMGKIVNICLEGVACIDTSPFYSEFGNFKPYLFPISSMTEEQWEELMFISEIRITFTPDRIIEVYKNTIEWFLKNHIDYNGLIEKGLAIDATGLNIY